MSRRFRSSGSGRRGFTLLEAMVSLSILVIVMVLTLTLVFSMRAFAERLSTRLVPRQTARQAINYLGFHIQGATDLNYALNNPNALVMQKVGTGGTATVQVSYNNLTAAQSAYGDLGTDIISLAVVTNPVSIPLATWPGLPTAGNPLALDLNYTAGCSLSPPDGKNLQSFKDATGAVGTASPVLTLVDSAGNWIYYQITSYVGSTCANVGGSNKTIQVVMTPAAASVGIPSGHSDLVAPVSLVSGVRYVSFRVKGGNLQQKQGLFDPASPDTGFSTIVNDVEDLQIAYLYAAAPDSTKSTVYTYNTLSDAIPATVGGVSTGGVPPQAGLLSTAVPTAWDITNVVGIRFSVTSRSELRFTSQQISQRGAETLNNFRPAVEDRTKGTVDGFDHYRVTTTAIVRNRMPGN